MGKCYRYKDRTVTKLPNDLPQPPSDYPVSFSECHYLVNIDALAKWDASTMTNTAGMFNHCRSLVDISPLRQWIMSNVTDMSYMFNCCYALYDVSAIEMWDVSKVTKMRFIFNGCHELPDFARLEVYDQQTFNCFVERYLLPLIVDCGPSYNTDDEIIEIEEEEVREDWNEETMGPHPFPNCYLHDTQKQGCCGELTVTINQSNGNLDDCSDDDDLMVTTTIVPDNDRYVPVPSDDDETSNIDLSMTLTPEMIRRYLISSSEDDEPY